MDLVEELLKAIDSCDNEKTEKILSELLTD